MNFAFKKIIIFFIIVSVVFNSTQGFLKPREAKAFACANCAVWWTQILDKMQSQWQWLQNNWQDMMRDLVAKRLIDYMVDQTTKWIQGGGEPKFVTDWQGFLSDAGQAAVGDVILQTDAAFLCSPFKLNVMLSLLPVPKFGQRVQCTLDSIVKNIDDFYNNFENGGWIAYNASMSPQNNYFGTILLTYDEMLAAQAKAKDSASKEAASGSGFLSVKECLEYETNSNLDATIQACSDNFSGDELSTCINAAQKAYPSKCTKEQINTPGSTVGAAVVENTVGSDSKWAANIKSWTSALVNAAINRLITEGVGLMKDSSSGGSSYTPPEYQSLIDKEIDSQKQAIIDQVKIVLNEWQYILNDKNKSLSAQQQIVIIYTSLNDKKCLPSVPDSDMQSAQSESARLQGEAADFQAKVDEANSLISKLTQAADLRDMAIAQQDINAFLAKYNTDALQEQITTGSARNAADAEFQTKQSDLTSAQARLTACVQIQQTTNP